MDRKLIVLIIAFVALIGVGLFTGLKSDGTDEDSVANKQSISTQEVDTSAQGCVSDDCLKVEDLEYPVGELPGSVVEALNSAIDDEYKARATYEAVINELGSARPFSMIIRAEEQHISSLKALYDKYGLDIPSDPYVDVEVASSRSDNCSVGVQAEIDNAALYMDNLLPAVTDYPDITSVFTRLMNASQDKHLPAFERCAR